MWSSGVPVACVASVRRVRAGGWETVGRRRRVIRLRVVPARDVALPFFVGVMVHRAGFVRVSLGWWQVVVRW
jgi:hypothetical protein